MSWSFSAAKLLAISAVAAISAQANLSHPQQNQHANSEDSQVARSLQRPTQDDLRLENFNNNASIDSVDTALAYFDRAYRTGNRVLLLNALDHLSSAGGGFDVVLQAPRVIALSALSLAHLFNQRWIVDEIHVFDALERWTRSRRQGNSSKSSAAAHTLLRNAVRLVALDEDELRGRVMRSGLFDCEQVVEALAIKHHQPANILQHLRFDLDKQRLHENVVSEWHHATLLTGEHPQILRRLTRPPSPGSYTFHPIGDANGITVQLDDTYLVNTFMVFTWHWDDRSYSYHIDISLDGQSWTRVVDQPGASGEQRYRIPLSTARFVRLVGTQCSVPGEDMKLYAFQAMYSN